MKIHVGLAVPARIAFAAFIAVVGTCADASAQQMRAQNGVVLPMPRIAAMGCLSMSRLMKRFSDSGYRGLGPLSPDDPDYPLFEYEDRLAAAFYERCRKGRSAVEKPSDVFRPGFE